MATPPVLIAFDVLYRNGEDLTAGPLSERRLVLEDVITGAAMVYSVRRLAPNGLEAWAQVLEASLSPRSLSELCALRPNDSKRDRAIGSESTFSLVANAFGSPDNRRLAISRTDS